ncbi:MAG TPA: hypothetical protein VMT87_16570 [Vicinamibacteria bacterium]|nr:hypothetical protein [Vicinamibacteria bacterium]
MRREAAAAERRFEVREAAAAWHRARAVDDATRQGIEAAYPDDRARLPPAFRVLVFGFTVLAVTTFFSLFGFVIAVAGQEATAFVLLLFGLLLVAATELQMGRLRRRQGGTESATALLAVSYLSSGLVWVAGLLGGVRGDGALNLALVVFALVGGAAAFRWGYTLFAVAATAALFVLAARSPIGRVLWIAGPLALVPVLARAGEAASLPPAHRRAARAMAAVSLVFLYMAVHRGSWDVQMVEMIAGRTPARPQGGALAVLSALATGLLPVLTLAWGVVTRRRWPIGLGALGVLASLVTLRFYVHVAPLWLVLLLGGGCALALATALRRYLDSGAGRERGGLTAEPLFGGGDGSGALELAVGAASATPEARPVESPGLQPGGGRFGGGGASGTY